MEQLPLLQRMRLNKITFPHFEFECRETESGELVAPDLELALKVTPLGEGRYATDIRAESSSEGETSFRVLVVARLEFALAEEEAAPANEEQGQFLELNSIVLAWPYLREMISTATARMGYPPWFMPMLDVSRIYFGPPEEEEKVEPADQRVTEGNAEALGEKRPAWPSAE